jgi:hypothetical protein
LSKRLQVRKHERLASASAQDDRRARHAAAAAALEATASDGEPVGTTPRGSVSAARPRSTEQGLLSSSRRRRNSSSGSGGHHSGAPSQTAGAGRAAIRSSDAAGGSGGPEATQLRAAIQAKKTRQASRSETIAQSNLLPVPSFLTLKYFSTVFLFAFPARALSLSFSLELFLLFAVLIVLFSVVLFFLWPGALPGGGPGPANAAAEFGRRRPTAQDRTRRILLAGQKRNATVSLNWALNTTRHKDGTPGAAAGVSML